MVEGERSSSRAIARAARSLPYVAAARASGRFARVEVPHDHSPGPLEVEAGLRSLPGVGLVERVPVDTESMLLHLARAGGGGAREAAA